MRTRMVVVAAGIVAAAAAVVGMAERLEAAPLPLPTMADIQKLADDGQWREGLAAIARVLDLKGTAAAPYDRGALLMLKAECQLQLHDNSGMLATLNLARREATDAKGAAEPTALIELVQKSPGGTYTPKKAGAAPISVLDRAKRKDAYRALATDELAALAPRVKAAANVTTLQPLVALGKVLAPARAAEIAGTGKSEQTDVLTAQLAAQAVKLMNNGITGLASRVQAVSLSANQQVAVIEPLNFGGGHVAPAQVVRPKGLTTSDQIELRNIKQECDRFPPAAKELALAFGDEKGFASVEAQALQIKSRADAVLNANYDGSGIGGAINPR